MPGVAQQLRGSAPRDLAAHDAVPSGHGLPMNRNRSRREAQSPRSATPPVVVDLVTSSGSVIARRTGGGRHGSRDDVMSGIGPAPITGRGRVLCPEYSPRSIGACPPTHEPTPRARRDGVPLQRPCTPTPSPPCCESAIGRERPTRRRLALFSRRLAATPRTHRTHAASRAGRYPSAPCTRSPTQAPSKYGLALRADRDPRP